MRETRTHEDFLTQVQKDVAMSLSQDIGDGDITANLIKSTAMAEARVIAREPCVVCGISWFNKVFECVDSKVQLHWLVKEGDWVAKNQALVTISGKARSLVTAEREALNWLQTLSGTATTVAHYASFLEGSATRLLDTRKTIPGLRFAQKYAVTVGGGKNHRMGLYDAFLIKENHIISCGSIQSAVTLAKKQQPGKLVEVEVESLSEMQEAIRAGADIIMLDNFSVPQVKEAVATCDGRAKLEVSGNVTEDQLKVIVETGVDYISVGALTKHVKAIDLSMRFEVP